MTGSDETLQRKQLTHNVHLYHANALFRALQHAANIECRSKTIFNHTKKNWSSERPILFSFHAVAKFCFNYMISCKVWYYCGHMITPSSDISLQRLSSSEVPIAKEIRFQKEISLSVTERREHSYWHSNQPLLRSQTHPNRSQNF